MLSGLAVLVVSWIPGNFMNSCQRDQRPLTFLGTSPRQVSYRGFPTDLFQAIYEQNEVHLGISGIIPGFSRARLVRVGYIEEAAERCNCSLCFLRLTEC